MKVLERRSRRQRPRTLSVGRYAMEGILSAIFILQDHHCTRSPSRTANVKPADACQSAYEYMQTYRIDTNLTSTVKNIEI